MASNTEMFPFDDVIMLQYTPNMIHTIVALCFCYGYVPHEEIVKLRYNLN